MSGAIAGNALTTSSRNIVDKSAPKPSLIQPTRRRDDTARGRDAMGLHTSGKRRCSASSACGDTPPYRQLKKYDPATALSAGCSWSHCCNCSRAASDSPRSMSSCARSTRASRFSGSIAAARSYSRERAVARAGGNGDLPLQIQHAHVVGIHAREKVATRAAYRRSRSVPARARNRRRYRRRREFRARRPAPQTDHRGRGATRASARIAGRLPGLIESAVFSAGIASP